MHGLLAVTVNLGLPPAWVCDYHRAMLRSDCAPMMVMDMRTPTRRPAH
jgi:hypothetical protein